MAGSVDHHALATQIAAVIESQLRDAGYVDANSNDILQGSTLRLEGLLSSGPENRRIHLVIDLTRVLHERILLTIGRAHSTYHSSWQEHVYPRLRPKTSQTTVSYKSTMQKLRILSMTHKDVVYDKECLAVYQLRQTHLTRNPPDERLLEDFDPSLPANVLPVKMSQPRPTILLDG